MRAYRHDFVGLAIAAGHQHRRAAFRRKPRLRELDVQVHRVPQGAAARIVFSSHCDCHSVGNVRGLIQFNSDMLFFTLF